MLISINNLNVIFIHIPKTAGTSVLGSLSNDENYKVTGHCLASKYTSDVWIKSFCFSVVRNPYDRFISHWLYHTTNYNGEIFSKRGIKIKNRSLEDYCKISKELSLRNQYVNWKTMTEFLYHESGKHSDLIIRFEDLNTGWTQLCHNLGISRTLFRLKPTPHLAYNNYYTNKTKSFVRDYYREDFINFNYDLEL